jgi:flagellar basal-body rod protein FlgG
MPNGIYSAAAGMVAQQSRMDAIANDLANANTTGYKAERIGFRDLLYGTDQGIAVGSGAAAIDVGRSLAQGTLQPSDDPLALAIQGPGFFQVTRADGTNALTRAGQLQLDAAGSLVTVTGEQLVPPIKVPAGTDPKDISVAADGTVALTGRTIGRISLVDVPSPNGLQPVGSSMFVPTQASGGVVPATAASLQQNQLESSNVDVATAMTDLLDAQQSYQLASRAIQTQDHMLELANGLRK